MRALSALSLVLTLGAVGGIADARPRATYRWMAGSNIGSHYTPTDPYYDPSLVKTYTYNPEKAKALLKQAGVTTPLEISIKLPPPPYARLGGEVVAAPVVVLMLYRVSVAFVCTSQ